VSYEKYFGRQAYISLAAFYKDLKTYVYDQSVVFDFTGFPTGGGVPAIRQGLVTTPQNGKGGSVKGVEFAASIPGALLTPMAGRLRRHLQRLVHRQLDPAEPQRPSPNRSRACRRPWPT
jgi:hypothetical protein